MYFHGICHLFLHMIFSLPPVFDYFFQPLWMSMRITYHKLLGDRHDTILLHNIYYVYLHVHIIQADGIVPGHLDAFSE